MPNNSMTFAVDLIPYNNGPTGSNTYTLGSEDYKWKIYADKINGVELSPSTGSLHNPVYISSSGFSATSGQTIEFINSTQTGTTASWKGNTADTALYDGKIIAYRLNKTSDSTVTLTLTFPDGTNSGAKPVYRYGGTTRIGTHFAAGSVIFMVYDSTNSRWNCSAYYDSNTNTYVTQTASTLADNWRGVLSTYNSAASGSDITSGTSNVAYYSQQVRIQPATGKLSATEFVGSGASLTSLNASNISSGTLNSTLLDLNSTTSLGTIGTTSKLYAVGVDDNGELCVEVPWSAGSGTVTSVQVQASSPLQSSTNTAQNTSLNTTISFINQDANKVLAGPTSGNAAAPTFRALDATDIPNLTLSKITDSGAAAAKGVTDNTSNADVTSTDQNLITGRTLYYQLAKKGYTTNTGTVTSIITGTGLTGGTIETSGTIKANLTSDTALSNAALTVTEDANRIYPVRIDKNSKLVVVVPWTNVNSNYLTEITSSQITTALGYTPYNSSNPSGYTTNTGTVTQVTAGTGLSIGTTSGGNFTTSGTINHTNSVTAQTTQAVYPIKIDAQGHISAYGSAVTILSLGDTASTAAAGNHTHTTTLATDTGTSTVSLASDGKYKLTAGGTSVIFTMPKSNYYEHPTTTATTAAAVKVGNDINGHVVIGAALTASDVGAASSSHDHAISITSGGSSPTALSANTTYTLTAGGQSVVFTTPADDNDDTKVLQEYHGASDYSYWRPILIGHSSGSASSFTPSTVTNQCHTFKTILVQPSSGTIKAGVFDGSGASLTDLNASNLGSGTVPTARLNLNSTSSLGTLGTTDKLYAVGVDASGKLCVNVPWSSGSAGIEIIRIPSGA